MCTSKNLICKHCERKNTSWDECPEIGVYRVETTNMDLKPDNPVWMRKHSIAKPTKMLHEFIIVVCKSCEGSDPNKVESVKLMSTIAAYTNTYAGNFIAWVAGSNSKPVKWTKLTMIMNTKARDIDTESEIEPIIRSMNKKVDQNSAEDDDRTETEDEDESENGSDDDDDDDDDDDESDADTK